MISKRNQNVPIAPRFFKDKIKLLAVLKKLERNKTKAFGPKIFRTDRKRFVSIQNFVSKTNIFDIFFERK
jgi:hypothetical protein